MASPSILRIERLNYGISAGVILVALVTQSPPVTLGLAVGAGLKAMEILGRPGTYERLEHLGKKLGDGLLAAAHAAGVPAVMNRVGSMLTLFFSAAPVTDYATAKSADTARFAAFFRRMRDRGVFLPPSQYETMFVSLAHTEDDIDQIVGAARAALAD